MLKPGTTRGKVEGYLGARNTPFNRKCCVDAERLSDRASWDDLVKIGEEKPPWYCSENWVYIAFQFIDHNPPSGISQTADDLDTLKSFTVNWGAVCDFSVEPCREPTPSPDSELTSAVK